MPLCACSGSPGTLGTSVSLKGPTAVSPGVPAEVSQGSRWEQDPCCVSRSCSPTAWCSQSLQLHLRSGAVERFQDRVSEERSSNSIQAGEKQRANLQTGHVRALLFPPTQLRPAQRFSLLARRRCCLYSWCSALCVRYPRPSHLMPI